MMIPIPPGGPASAAQAFERANWKTLLPRLLRCAHLHLRRLGWAETTLTRHSALEAMELVDMAVDTCLSEKRTWTLPADATEDQLVRHLFMTMRALSTNCRTSAVVALRAPGDVSDLEESLGESLDESPSAERILIARAELARIEREIEGDDDVLALCKLLQDPPRTREGIAAALSWTVQRVAQVRRRLSRLLEARGLLHDQNDEAGPPSPQRSHHENPGKAPGERRRAPRQPDGGRRLAGRRR